MWGGLIWKRASATPGTQEEEDEEEATKPTEKARSRTKTNKDNGVDTTLTAGTSAEDREGGFFGRGGGKGIIIIIIVPAEIPRWSGRCCSRHGQTTKAAKRCVVEVELGCRVTINLDLAKLLSCRWICLN